jgi:hypothetical protein
MWYNKILLKIMITRWWNQLDTLKLAEKSLDFYWSIILRCPNVAIGFAGSGKCQISSMAQLVARKAVNLQVIGSNPIRGVTFWFFVAKQPVGSIGIVCVDHRRLT